MQSNILDLEVPGLDGQVFHILMDKNWFRNRNFILGKGGLTNEEVLKEYEDFLNKNQRDEQ